MSGKGGEMRALQAYLNLKKRADAGDPKAKAEIAKLVANPTAVARLKAIAAQATQAAQLISALTVAAPTQVQGDEEEPIGSPDDIYDGDDIDAAERAHRMLPPGSDSLDHKALLRKQKLASLSQVAPFVRTNPPSVLSGTLGGSQVVNSGETQQLINWAGADDSENHSLSVTIAPVLAPDEQLAFSATAAMRPFATVKWGTRAFQSQAEIDIGLGAQFVVSGSQITVEVTLPLVSGGTAGSMRLAAQLGFHPVERHMAPLTRTVYIDGIAAAGVSDVNIPAYAKTLQVWQDNAGATATITVETIEGVNAQVVQLGTVSPAIPYMFDPLWLSGDARIVEIGNTSGSTRKYRLVFGLAI